MNLLSRRADVTVYERSTQLGGKMRQETVGAVSVDAGPTVLTMIGVFEQLFAELGVDLHDELTVRPLERLARHAWVDGTRFDLFRDEDSCAAEIERIFGAAERDNYLRFVEHCRAVYERVKGPFIDAPHPGARAAWEHRGFGGLSDMVRVDWHRSMWSALRSMFKTPHLRQLFARYATYYGSSPYAAPATLNLIAEVERAGVWVVEGGMHQLAIAMARTLRKLGARVELGAPVLDLRPVGSRWRLRTDAGSENYDAVVFNGDLRAISGGALGPNVRQAVPRTKRAPSSSALTWCLEGDLSGSFEADFHNVFFSEDYRAEFDAVFGASPSLPRSPSVYLCAQSRGPGAPMTGSGAEALFILANAPAISDAHKLDSKDIQRCEEQVHKLMGRCGLDVNVRATTTTRPVDFARRFPGSRGALYGNVTHSPFAPFGRATARSRMRGFYLAGGGTHPGAGIPMACMSGRFAAQAIVKDLGLMPRSDLVAICGGTSTSFHTTAVMR
jgi:1-hydroxycarotenoid 3,4-desaturase